MLIDCDTCAVRDLHCGDCVMTTLLSAPASRMELDTDEEAALSALAAGGLLPPLRLVPVAAPPAPAREARAGGSASPNNGTRPVQIRRNAAG